MEVRPGRRALSWKMKALIWFSIAALIAVVARLSVRLVELNQERRRRNETRALLDNLATRLRDATRKGLKPPRSNLPDDTTGFGAFCQGMGITATSETAELLNRGTYPGRDAWGWYLRYRCPGVVHPQGWDLYSVGPNGFDERGDGDDILVGEDTAATVESH